MNKTKRQLQPVKWDLDPFLFTYLKFLGWQWHQSWSLWESRKFDEFRDAVWSHQAGSSSWGDVPSQTCCRQTRRPAGTSTSCLSPHPWLVPELRRQTDGKQQCCAGVIDSKQWKHTAAGIWQSVCVDLGVHWRWHIEAVSTPDSWAFAFQHCLCNVTPSSNTHLPFITIQRLLHKVSR